jgi:hypothetical protein
MTVLIRAETWKWLSRLPQSDAAEFMDQLKAFLNQDFEQGYEIIRTQKLLSRSRCLETTLKNCSELGHWAKTAPLSSKERSKLIRHCRITTGFQSMMSSLRASTETLQIWKLCFPDFSRILISSMEAANVGFNKRMIDRIVSSRRSDFLTANSTKNWMFRAALDCALLVLNEGRERCAECSDFSIGSPSAFVESLQLAQDTSEVMLAWDFYSFGQIQVSVKEHEIKVNRPEPLAAARRGNYRQRMMELDIAQRNSAQQRLSMLAEDLKSTIPPSVLSYKFDEFIRSPTARGILDSLLSMTNSLERNIADALDALINLDDEVKLGRVRHVYRDLVTVWSYLVRVAVVSRMWGELVHSATDEFPDTTLTLNSLRGTFVGLREMSELATDKAIRHFSSFKDQKAPIDLFYRPLLRASEEEIFLPASYILNSRFDRNLISIVAREKNDSLAVKGKKPLRQLKALFEDAGFWCLDDISVRKSTGQLATDLDLLACRGDEVFLFQSKVLSIPDSPYEHWRIDQTLLSAACQMDVVLDHRVQLEQSCQKRDPSFKLEAKNISAYIITDVMVHSGFKLNGYEVVDFHHLQHILQGANIGVIDIRTQDVIRAFSAIENKYPSAREIRRLVSALRLPNSTPLKGITQRRTEVGGWVLILEAKAFD